MLATKRSAGVAPEVNLRGHISHIPLPSVNKTAHSGFETQRRCHQKSTTGVSVASQKGLMSSKKFIKKNIPPHAKCEYFSFLFLIPFCFPLDNFLFLFSWLIVDVFYLGSILLTKFNLIFWKGEGMYKSNIFVINSLWSSVVLSLHQRKFNFKVFASFKF